MRVKTRRNNKIMNPNITSKVGFVIEDKNITQASGNDIIQRIMEIRQILADAHSKINNSKDVKKVEIDLRFNFSDEKFLDLGFNSRNQKWQALFYDKNSTIMSKPLTYASGYTSQPYKRKYIRKSTKFESKMFEHIIKFVDNGLTP